MTHVEQAVEFLTSLGYAIFARDTREKHGYSVARNSLHLGMHSEESLIRRAIREGFDLSRLTLQ